MIRLSKGKGKYSIAVRAVMTEDFMTADFARVPPEKLREIKDELMKLPEVGEVLYDVTSKPPATIELE